MAGNFMWLLLNNLADSKGADLKRLECGVIVDKTVCHFSINDYPFYSYYHMFNYLEALDEK